MDLLMPLNQIIILNSKSKMGFNVQQGHQSNTTASAGDELNVNPISYGGGIQMGNIYTGDKT